MPTLLTTKKMSPELRARVLASVSGKTRAPTRGLRPSSISLMRVTAILMVGLAVGSILALKEQMHAELGAAREALLTQARSHAEGLSERDLLLPVRIKGWLTRVAGSYEGDTIDPVVQDPDGFTQVLSQPLVYLRGPIAAFENQERLADTTATSFRDAFVLCLLDPPKKYTETGLRYRVQKTLQGGVHTAPVAHVERFHSVLMGLPVLSPAFAQRVEAADTPKRLASLERAFERAPVEAARRGAKAELLLLLVDEPNDGSGPSELDGANPHWARILLIDLKTDTVLLRLRRHVSPRWLSDPVRVEYANGINACELALAVREAVGFPPLQRKKAEGAGRSGDGAGSERPSSEAEKGQPVPTEPEISARGVAGTLPAKQGLEKGTEGHQANH